MSTLQVYVEAVWCQGPKGVYPETFLLFTQSGVGHYLFYYHYGQVSKGMADSVKMLHNSFVRTFPIVIGPVAIHA